MKLPVQPPVKPMLAKLSRDLPEGDGLLYEPKWDGFRCIVFRDGDQVNLGSRNEKPMDRYFPELCESLRANLPERCVIDGEIVIATDHGLDFDALLQRIHPAASRIRKLARETPASFHAFDLLVDHVERGAPLFRLEPDPESYDRAAAAARAEQAAAAASNLRSGKRVEEIRVIEHQLQQARAALALSSATGCGRPRIAW